MEWIFLLPIARKSRDHGIAALNTVLHGDLAELWRAQQEIDAWYIQGPGNGIERHRSLPIGFD